MKKLITFLLLFTMMIVLSACKPVDIDEVDCTLNPEHEDCVEIDPCDENPDAPECNIVYTYEDTYEMLDFDNDEVDDFETVFANMNAVVNAASSLYEVREKDEFYDFYGTESYSEQGLTKEELLNYEQPSDILLAAIDAIYLTISGEVSRFAINLQDDEFVEDVDVDRIIFDDFNSTSRIFVNEDSFYYINEVEEIANPGVNVAFYEMTLIVDEDRLVFEIISYTDVSLTDGFDYAYTLYDSEVGFVVRNVASYNENLIYYENKVDLNEQTSEIKEISLGGFHIYEYSKFDYDEGIYYEKFVSRSQIGEYFGLNRVSFFEGYDEVLSFVEYTEFVDDFVPTRYSLSFNIAYLNDWDIVYEEYLIKNNSQVAYVQSPYVNSIANNHMIVALDFDEYPVESDLLEPFDGLTFDYVDFTDLVSEMDVYSAMDQPVFYDENIATVSGIDYDIRTELLDLFISDLPTIVTNNILDNMIIEDIIFGGEESIIPMIDCEVTPEHELCPDPQ